MTALRWIVVPARNEAARLAETIRTYLAALSPGDHIVVVVNGSTDDTSGVAARISTEDPRLEVVEEPLPVGKGGAIIKGFDHVLSRCANDDVVCLTDADGAVPPVELVRVCDSVRPGVLVAGSRWLDPSLQSPRQGLSRRLASRVFNRLVRLVLHLDIRDTQCPAKAVQASSLRPIVCRLDTHGFGFDLDFLLAAPLGRVAVKEVPIRWGDRTGSTVRLTRAVPSMIQEVARLETKYTRLAAQAGTTLSGWSAAVSRSGDAILPQARRCEAARRVLSRRQALLLAATITILVGLVCTVPLLTAIAVNAIVIAVYGLANLFKLILVHRSLEDPPVMSVEPRRDSAGDWDLPVFTILVPLYEEAAVVAQLVEGIARLDYPQAKLDVKLLLEEDDIETQLALEDLELPRCFQPVLVPDVGPRGKPRACNEGLRRARGGYLVIYDAEDRPEPDQLRKVVAAFDQAPGDVACLQAKLSYFNRGQNLLTRWFTAEYSMWFDLLLPGLRSLDVPIPARRNLELLHHRQTARAGRMGLLQRHRGR
jgi:glycosyltransferase involved in cell wall biosynthesis